MLVATMPGTKLNVWPGSIKLITTHPEFIKYNDQINCKVLDLDKGDVVFFRADLVHAGSSYDKENVRLHCFLDSEFVQRQPNRTFLIRKHGSEELSNLIL